MEEIAKLYQCADGYGYNPFTKQCYPIISGFDVKDYSSLAPLPIVAKVGNYVTLRLPSKEIRLVFKECYATIGRVGNIDTYSVVMGKAGRKRWLGYRPQVRGVVMNPCDHPHGGGEGRSPIGRSSSLLQNLCGGTKMRVGVWAAFFYFSL